MLKQGGQTPPPSDSESYSGPLPQQKNWGGQEGVPSIPSLNAKISPPQSEPNLMHDTY